MNKTITLLSTALLSFGSVAQPVINYSSSHSIGMQCTMYVIGGSTTSLQQTGASVTWNLSSNSVTQAGTYNMVDPANTPYGSSYPSANLAMEMNVTGQGVSYTYVIDSPTEMNSIADGIGGSSPTVWTQYDKLVNYPFHYLDAFSATRQSSTGSPEAYTRTYDAYGTLTINGQTYTNVARVTKNPGNSIWFNTTTLFPVIIQANSTTYLYNEPTAWAGVDKIGAKNEVKIYPNPAKDSFTLQVDGNSIGNGSALEIVNSIGQTVMHVEIKEERNQVSVSGLAPGLYFYQLKNKAGGVSTGKIIVE